MRGIPPVLETDSEDVAWALQTADALWLRNERVDALVWLRRAAQAAGDSGDNDRAVTLARAASELSDAMNQSSGQGPTDSHSERDAIDDLLNVSRQDAPPGQPARPLPKAEIIERPVVDEPDDMTETFTAVSERRGKGVLPAGPNEVYDDDVVTSALRNPLRGPGGSLGMPPPPRNLAPPPPRPPPPPKPPAPRPPPSDDNMLSDADLVTVPPAPLTDSQTIHLPRSSGSGNDGTQDSVTTRIAPEHVLTVAGADESGESLLVHVVSIEDSVRPPAYVPHAPHAPPPEPAISDEGAAEAAERKRRSEDETAGFDVPPGVIFARAEAEDLARQVNESGTMATMSSVRIDYPPADASEDLSEFAADPAFLDAMPSMPERATDRPIATQERGGKEVVELDRVDALSDIPDEEREAFAAKASLHELTQDDEIASFALALVISGEVDVVAMVLDATEPIAPGTVLRSRGTNEKGFELRLVCRSDKARVATWPSAPVEAAFKSCPWVEDDLRIATDRLQALVGITSGPLADRLDASLRQEIVRRMSTRALAPHEVLLKKGDTVPGLYVVGVSGLEVLDGDAVTGSIVVGDFVFPTQVLGTGPAPTTVRAPIEGAVVLFADRKVAQELLVTCPPLLEILAGM